MITIPPREDLVTQYETRTDAEVGAFYQVGAATVRRWRRQYLILSRRRGPRTRVLGLAFSTVSDQAIRDAVAQCFSIYAVCRRVGLCETGSGHRKMKDKIASMGLGTSHFGTKRCSVLGHNGLGQDLSTYLVKGNRPPTTNLRRRLISEGLLSNQCSCCGMLPVWHGQPLVMHLDHINGDRTDNQLENLRLLCPNCHSQTSTYCGRNQAKSKTKSPRIPVKRKERKQRFCACGQIMSKGAKGCRHCHPGYRTKVQWPSAEELSKMVWERPVQQLAKHWGVSDQAIAKRCHRANIAVPPRGYWQKRHAQMKQHAQVSEW